MQNYTTASLAFKLRPKSIAPVTPYLPRNKLATSLPIFVIRITEKLQGNWFNGFWAFRSTSVVEVVDILCLAVIIYSVIIIWCCENLNHFLSD